MNETFFAKFKTNLQFAFHRAVTWSVAFWGSLEIIWNAIDNDVRLNLLNNFMSPKWVSFTIAVFLIVSHFVANGWPQPKLAAKIEAKKALDQTKAAGADSVLPNA